MITCFSRKTFLGKEDQTKTHSCTVLIRTIELHEYREGAGRAHTCEPDPRQVAIALNNMNFLLYVLQGSDDTTPWGQKSRVQGRCTVGTRLRDNVPFTVPSAPIWTVVSPHSQNFAKKAARRMQPPTRGTMSISKRIVKLEMGARRSAQEYQKILRTQRLQAECFFLIRINLCNVFRKTLLDHVVFL